MTPGVAGFPPPSPPPARGGEKPPFDTIVTRHGPTVLRVARAVAGQVDADDAWSDTFLAALKAYPGLPADANVEAWLVTIAHRKALDIARARARHAIPVAEPPEHPGGTRADERDLDLADALAALPDKQRHAVAYHHLAGLPYALIGEILDTSEAAARRAAADGIARLRRTYLPPPPDADQKQSARHAKEATS